MGNLFFLNKRRDILIILLFIIFAIVFFTINPSLKKTFEYDSDEGFELMKSSLYLNGFSLYSQIYSDQPPLYTVILSFWFKLFGSSAYQGRILNLIFSLILILTFYYTIKAWWGNFCAFMGAIFLLTSSLYIPLSTSVMIGTASLSLAMLSIYCITCYRKLHLKRYLFLSAIFIAFSLHTKLFTLFLIPLIPLEIIHAEKLNTRKTNPNNLLLHILLWIGITLIAYLTIAIIFFHSNLTLYIQSLVKPHLKKLILPESGFSNIWKMIKIDYDIAFLALIGVILIIKQKGRHFFLPLLWLISVFIIYVYHRPIWPHYYLLFSIPLSWLAAICFRNLSTGGTVKKGVFHWLMLILITITILRLPFKFTTNIRSVKNQATIQEYKTLNNLLLKYKPFTRWIATDRPIFAFYANLLVPPELTLTGHKRKFINDAEQIYFIDILEKYKPEQILLQRSNFYGPKIISYIENYINIYQGKLSRKMQNYYEMRNYLPFNLHIGWRRKPLGEYLPHSMRFSSNKRFYNLIWNSIYIPRPILIKKQKEKQKNFYIQYTDINLFIRKDIIAQNHLKKNLR